LDRLDRATLFLDLDGTLLDLVQRPDEALADEDTRNLLRALNYKLEGRLAVVSGRSLEQVDRILGPGAAEIAVSASHGCEHRWNGIHARPERPASLGTVAARFRAFARQWPAVIIEEKSFGVALHYRTAPEAAGPADALAQSLAEQTGLHFQQGKMVAELRVAGGDKGAAVHRLMGRASMAGSSPLFAGDDLTDEPGFCAARELGGDAILVGEPRRTRANFGLRSPASLRQWLKEAVA
jgi:trehalose 6-phosphate phosphatase